MTSSRPVLHATGNGRMAAGGTRSYTVVVAGVVVGVVADQRKTFPSGRLGARTWIAAWREDRTAREPARWTGEGYPTRQAAVEALLAAREEGSR